MAQTPWELERLLDLVASGRGPAKILEIGIWEGGTLWEWIQIADLVVGVDDAMRPPGTDEWEKWADGMDCELHLIKGSSHDPDVVNQVAKHGPFDFVFIDADHTYQSVLADWTNYGPLGRIVAFHDIRPRPGYGVDQLWDNLKNQYGARTVEIVETHPPAEWQNGIGVIWPT